MNQFYKSVVRLLLVTAFLLLIAWVSMKIMQGDLNLEGLMKKGEKIAGDLGKNLDKLNESVIQPARKAIEPRLDDLVQWARNMINHR